MVPEDFIDLQASSGSGGGSENNELCNSNCDPSDLDSQPSGSQGKEDISNKEELEQSQCDEGNIEGQHVQDMVLDNDLVEKPLILQESIRLDETVITAEKITKVDSLLNSENGFATAQKDIDISNHKIEDSPISGVKRARITYADQEPSVRVIYNSLPSASKRKLEEVLQQWSEWNAQHDSSINKPHEALVSGEETFFPALHVGLEKASTVSFWMDNETRKEQTEEIVRVDGDSAPLYDRGYSLGLTSMDGSTNVERGLEASRCFNCGSYNHSLKECHKPRDNVAVNNARKQHNSKRTQNAGPHKPTRYYQNSAGGKYDGLRPGFLGPETRQLLGIGEFDPPPWLHRMREIGYPPGYLDPDDEDLASGITIYLDEKTKEDHEDGELSETDEPEPIQPKKKMSVEFPGINAPIPEKADERRWASLQGGSSFDQYRNRFNPNSSCSSEAINRGHYSDQRRSRDYRDDGPPGCDPEVGQSTFIPSYGGYDPNFATDTNSPRGHLIPRSPNLGRSLSDRGRWSPLVHEGSPNRSPHNTLPQSTPNTRHSSQSYSSPSYENWAYSSNPNSYSGSSSQRKERHERHHHHRR